MTVGWLHNLLHGRDESEGRDGGRRGEGDYKASKTHRVEAEYQVTEEGETKKRADDKEEQRRMREKLAEIHITLYVLKNEADLLVGDKDGC